jgi:EF-P beta-lysylation protein EpmB
MITRSDPIRQVPAWQREMAGAVRDPAELLRLLGLGPELLAGAAAESFPLLVPRGFVARMHCGDPGDPLLRQVLPLDSETNEQPGFVTDPVGDLAARGAPGLLHKYRGRALLTMTGACAVHCRYCFRRHFPYADESVVRDPAPALDHIARDASIHEVILSGGDPLTLSDRRLAEIVRLLAAIPHLRRLRVHTRLPVVLPSRVTDACIAALTQTRLPCVVVVHANHANEIDEAVRAACARMRAAGITLLNQSVLLRGVNDDVDALANLSETLFEAGVLPYYLHALDKVRGAAHFDVDAGRARVLMDALRARLPGYLAPRLVREQAGAPFKLLIG